MKRKLLIFSTILCVVCLVVAIVFFFLMKNAETSKKEDSENYDMSYIVEKIEFLKLNTYDEIKQYADEYPIYIQTSDDANLFAIGELYIEENSVSLFYQLNDDKTIKRFDGKYLFELDQATKDDVWDAVATLNRVIVEYFYTETFEHSMFDADGVAIDVYDEESYESMLNGEAKYNMSIIDENNTYWNISAVVTEKKQIEIEFFRCYDLSVYDDDSPNLDLRIIDETGE